MSMNATHNLSRLRGNLDPTRKNPTRQRGKMADTEGFTKLDLLALLAVVGLLGALALPALAGNRERSLRLLCVNNLRLAGQAIQQWGTEHQDRLPWRTPWCDGGTMPSFSGYCLGAPLPGSRVGSTITAGSNGSGCP